VFIGNLDLAFLRNALGYESQADAGIPDILLAAFHFIYVCYYHCDDFGGGNVGTRAIVSQYALPLLLDHLHVGELLCRRASWLGLYISSHVSFQLTSSTAILNSSCIISLLTVNGIRMGG
jgi:hypothetical protein